MTTLPHAVPRARWSIILLLSLAGLMVGVQAATVTITSTVSGPVVLGRQPIPVTIVWDTPMPAFAVDQIILTNAILTGFAASDGTDQNFSAILTPVASGITGLTIPAAAATGRTRLWRCCAEGTGRVAAWGGNAYTQCNLPATINDQSAVVEVATGNAVTLALTSDGRVSAWGQGTATVVPAVLTGVSANVVAIRAGYYAPMAIRGDGTAMTWGGFLITVPADLTDVIDVGMGENHALALSSTGTVRAFGVNTEHCCDVPYGLSNVKAVAAGDSTSQALKQDGTVVAWGDGTYNATLVPNQLVIPTADYVGEAISVSKSSVMVLLQDGRTMTWGGLTPLPPLDGAIRLRRAALGHGWAVGLRREADALVGWGNQDWSTPPAGVAGIRSLSALTTHVAAVYQRLPVTFAFPSSRFHDAISGTITFGTAVTALSAASLEITNGTATVTPRTGADAGLVFDITVTATLSAPGLVRVGIPHGAAVTAGGITNDPNACHLIFENVPPTATIVPAAGQQDPVNHGPIVFTVTCSEPLASFGAADVVLSGTAGATTATVEGSGPVYTVRVAGMVRTGTVVLGIAAGVVQDLAGNGILATSSAATPVLFDITPPTVALDSTVPAVPCRPSR